MNAMKRRWNGFVHAWETFDRSLRPGEDEGPLHWVEPAGGDPQLRGSTIPARTGVGQAKGPLTTFSW